ncbi:hypothetical protein VSDG_04523 [Cytospora chrysosperma]|uniref:Phospho-2-dehydro-3-deoxyheptonate aldolase n=1 Tax=Cytospora chrysosperma TaxID=252740 RepID=A0A423W2K6_CYTCH|nr:hypothetical protein VSDG_04523 [Valsa sordida]
MAPITSKLSPGSLKTELPLDDQTLASVASSRATIKHILSSPETDDRLLVIVGPCSIHDTGVALDYAERLSALSSRLRGDLVVIMRVYVEKPRTTVGWKGLVHDPDLTQAQASCLDRGLHVSRSVMARVAALGLPVATEMLSPLVVPFVDDVVSLGVIGARTTESQTHRELASDVPFPVGFKNGTDGGLAVALDAIQAAGSPHTLLAVDEHGSLVQRLSAGNENTFVVLRGGKSGPNYGPEHVRQAEAAMRKAGRRPALVVDASHGNSNKDYRNQAKVAASVGEQIVAGAEIAGIMIESNIQAGRQDIPECGMAGLEYGVSVTDGCVGWQETQDVLENLAAAVRARRASKHQVVAPVETGHTSLNGIARTTARTRDFVEKLLQGAAPVELV